MNIVTMYTKGMRPYCVRAEHFLQRKQLLKLVKIEIDKAPGEMQIMMTRTGHRTVPQIFVGETLVGGYDDLLALDRAGKLDALLLDNIHRYMP